MWYWAGLGHLKGIIGITFLVFLGYLWVTGRFEDKKKVDKPIPTVQHTSTAAPPTPSTPSRKRHKLLGRRIHHEHLDKPSAENSL